LKVIHPFLKFKAFVTNSNDPRAIRQWDKSEISFHNFLDYLDKKVDRFELTYIDLLYISNFKGGNATFNDSEKQVNEKLKIYSTRIKAINEDFNSLSLAVLKTDQIKKLIEQIKGVIILLEGETKIDGFGASYLSALLNAYFPNLIPILDRRVLINLQIVNDDDLDSQKQVKEIKRFYGILIEKVAEISRNQKLTLREIDRQYFIPKIDKKK